MTDYELDDWKHLICILEVDLEYSEDLHNLHNDYPLAPEHVKPFTAAIRGSGYKLFVKWCRYPGARLERYLQNGTVIRRPGQRATCKMAPLTRSPALHIGPLCKNKTKTKKNSYNIYGFAINRIYKKTLQCISQFFGGGQSR